MRKPLRLEMSKVRRQHIPTFPKVIQEMSPQFCEIYDHAADSESLDLDQIGGVGYGRALEFLVKDYAKRTNSAAAQQIEMASLLDCIKNFTPDQAMLDSTDLARGCRNEKTHYSRRYESRDVQDLKRLIKLTVAVIENAESAEAWKEKPRKKKPL